MTVPLVLLFVWFIWFAVAWALFVFLCGRVHVGLAAGIAALWPFWAASLILGICMFLAAAFVTVITPENDEW